MIIDNDLLHSYLYLLFHLVSIVKKKETWIYVFEKNISIHRAPLVRWSFHKYKCLWGVGVRAGVQVSRREFHIGVSIRVSVSGSCRVEVEVFD